MDPFAYLVFFLLDLNHSNLERNQNALKSKFHKTAYRSKIYLKRCIFGKNENSDVLYIHSYKQRYYTF